MSARAAATAAVLVCLLLTPAHAHRVIEGVGGFAGGALHPLLVPAHGLALLALGLVAGTQPPRRRLAVIAAFIGAFVACCGLIATAFSTANAETAVLALATLAGLALAAGMARHIWPAIAVAGGIGCAMAFDSVPAVPSIAETSASLAGTLLAATVAATLIAFASAALPAIWQRVGLRIAGSWIAASAVMVLALRLVS